MQNTETRREPGMPEELGVPRLPRYISVKDLAIGLDVSRLYLYRLFHRGLLPGRKAGRKIDILESFAHELFAVIASGSPVDIEAWAADWQAMHAASAVAS